MTDDAAGSASKDGDAANSSASKVVDSANSAAEATRSTAKWIATALAAIPALGAFGALVRAPGDAGFDPAPLFAGILFTAVAAIIGVLSIARVIAPAPMSDQALIDERFDIGKVPGQAFPSYPALLASLADVRTAYLGDELLVSDSLVDRGVADAAAAGSEAELAVAEIALLDDPNNKDVKDAVTKARLQRDRARAAAKQAVGTAAAREAGFKLLATQLDARETVRARALQLATAENVGKRYRDALVLVAAAVLLGALGVFFLATAPRPKIDAAAAPTLVTITLNAAGQATLSCAADTLQAIRVGGTDQVPKLITLPTDDCPSQTVDFTVVDPAPLGSLARAMPAVPPSAAPVETPVPPSV